MFQKYVSGLTVDRAIEDLENGSFSSHVTKFQNGLTATNADAFVHKKRKAVAPKTPPVRVEGVVVMSQDEYALMDDKGDVWWFDNIQTNLTFPSDAFFGPDHQVKDKDGNYVDLSVMYDYVMAREDPGPHLKAEEGIRLSFVPREREALHFENGKLVIHENKDGFKYDKSIPVICKGVATETRLL